MYKFEKYNFRVFTLLFALMALIFGFNYEFIGMGISVVLGTLLTFSYQGVQIDPKANRYMKYDRFLWLRIGQWMPLSTPCYVTIVRINLSNRRTMASPMVLPEGKKGAKSFKVNLVVDGKERFIPICRGEIEKMIPEALRLGEILNLRVLDYTTHEKKWIS
jgi:hypothetical protein